MPNERDATVHEGDAAEKVILSLRPLVSQRTPYAATARTHSPFPIRRSSIAIDNPVIAASHVRYEAKVLFLNPRIDEVAVPLKTKRNYRL